MKCLIMCPLSIMVKANADVTYSAIFSVVKVNYTGTLRYSMSVILKGKTSNNEPTATQYW